MIGPARDVCRGVVMRGTGPCTFEEQLLADRCQVVSCLHAVNLSKSRYCAVSAAAAAAGALAAQATQKCAAISMFYCVSSCAAGVIFVRSLYSK